MTHAPRNDSTEQRRRLLKGALGASTVVTLGYGAPAAAASLGCVANVRENGGYPIGDYRLRMRQPASGSSWAWNVENLPVFEYRGRPTMFASEGTFNGFEFGGKVYPVVQQDPDKPEPAASVDPSYRQDTGTTQQVWALAYFDDDGVEYQGTYPTGEEEAREGATPAQQSCLASLTPGGAPTKFTYGG